MNELIDVTSLNRPDPSWRFTDAAGHEHRWHVRTASGEMVPAEHYSPMQRYVVPTVHVVVDYPESEDYPAVTHLECNRCGARVTPGGCADTHRQFICGFTHG